MSYEIIVQVGDFEDMNAKSGNGKLAEEILKKYMEDFEKRNPTLYVFSAHLHMDEATLHLHIDFVPYSSGNKRGLATKNTLKGALNQLGFNGDTKSSTELNQWQDSENEVVAKIMLERGIEWEKKGGGKKHLSVEQFKAEQRALEVKKPDKVIVKKSLQANDLTIEISDKQDEVRELSLEAEQLDDVINTKSKKVEDIDKKLNSMLKDSNAINTTNRQFEDDAEWQLPNPPMLTTAGGYKDKFAQALVSKLKDFITSLLIRYINLKRSFEKVSQEKNRLQGDCNRYGELIKEKSYQADKYTLLEKIMGKDKIDSLIENHHRELELAPKMKKTKTYER